MELLDILSYDTEVERIHGLLLIRHIILRYNLVRINK